MPDARQTADEETEAAMRLRIVHPDGSFDDVTLDPSSPVFLGRDERCTIRLKDPSAHPVHARIRHDGGAWVLDVAQGAPPVLVNNEPTSNVILHPGDVVTIGNTRVEVRVPTPAKAAAPVGGKRAQAAAAFADVLPPESTDVANATTQPRRRVAEPPSESLLKSPLIIGSTIALIALIVLGIWLYFWYYGRTSEAAFDQAQRAMQEGRSVYARKLFERFLEEYPDHELANLALIYRELCDVQAALNESDLRKAQQEIQDLFDRTSKLPELQGVLDDIAQTIVRVGTAAAEVAQTTGEREDFELARQLRQMLDRYVPPEKQDPDAVADLDRLLAAAEAAVIKHEKYEATIATMKEAIEQGDTETAYRARDELVAIYPDLETDKQITELMARAAEVDLARCTWETVDLLPEPGDRPRVSRYVVPLVAAPNPGRIGSVGYAVARGAMYGLDGDTGAPLWRRFVGFDAVRLPLDVPSSIGPRIALLDTLNQDLLLLDPSKGSIYWRVHFEEGLFASPLFHRGKLYVPTLQGNLYRIDAGTGRVDGRLSFGPQELELTPVPSRTGRHLYVLGEHSNLYVVEVRPDRLEAVKVFYTGHLKKTILASPLRMDRYLVLCENRQPGECILRVLLTGEDEVTIEDLKQDLELPGWVLSTPALYGNLIYVATDRDTVHIFSAGAPEAREGLKKVTEARPASGSGPASQAYVLFLGEEDLVVVGSSVRHYRFSAERQILRPTEQLAEFQGTPLQAPVSLGGGRFLIVWQPEKQPEVRATLVQFADGKFTRVWEDRLAPGFISADLVEEGGNRTLYILAGSGMVYQLSQEIVASEGDVFLTQPLCAVEHDPDELRRARRVTLPGGTIVYLPAGGSTRLLLRDSASSSKVRTIRLAAAAQSPVGFAGGILVASEDSRLYLLDPGSGEELAQPFQPPLQSDQQLRWVGMAALDAKRILAIDSEGRAFIVGLREEQQDGTAVRYLAAVAETTLAVPARGSIAVSGEILAYLDEEGKVTVARIPDFAPLSRLEMPDIRVGPIPIGGQIIIGTADGTLAAVGSDGQLQWQVELPAPLVSEPTPTGETLLCVCEDATLRVVNRADGSVAAEYRIGEPLIGPAVSLGNNTVCFGRDGTVHVIEAD